MNIKSGLVLKNIGTGYAVIPVGGSGTDFRGVVRLNATGAEIWRGLEEGLDAEMICARIAAKYTVPDSSALLKDVEAAIAQFRSEGLLED